VLTTVRADTADAIIDSLAEAANPSTDAQSTALEVSRSKFLRTEKPTRPASAHPDWVAAQTPRHAPRFPTARANSYAAQRLSCHLMCDWYAPVRNRLGSIADGER
jgi:hypothetical protein